MIWIVCHVEGSQADGFLSIWLQPSATSKRSSFFLHILLDWMSRGAKIDWVSISSNLDFSSLNQTLTGGSKSFCSSSYSHISTARRFRIRLIWCDPYLAVRNFSRRSLTSPFSVKFTLKPCRPGDLSQSFIVSTPHCMFNFRGVSFILAAFRSAFTSLKVNKNKHKFHNNFAKLRKVKKFLFRAQLISACNWVT